MTYTLLHISDLHRSDADPIGNAELISALLADRARIAGEDPPVGAPDAIVLTGDLIHGARLGVPDHEVALDEQYAVARDLLTMLAERFLGGDRSRLVILPGNHDIDWNLARAAMEPVPDDEIPEHFSALSCGPTSDLRWCWAERRVYRIVDRPLYEQRLARLDALVADIYADVDILTRPLYRIHRLAGDRIALVAFDSCLGNDCYALHGKIDDRAIADAYVDLCDLAPELCVAAWHHSIEGEPADTAYMSPSTVEDLIGKGFRLGLHGHQHRAAAANRYVHLPNREEIAVISAGSLCAAGPGLPTGVARQYNLIEIADDLCSARVHVREMAIANNFAPANRTEFGLASYLELDWQLPAATLERQAHATDAQILAAERAIAAGEYAEAEAALAGIAAEPGSYPRDLLRTALTELQAWDRLADALDPPATIAELSAAVSALVELGEHDRAEVLLDAYAAPLSMADPDATELRRVIAARRALA